MSSGNSFQSEVTLKGSLVAQSLAQSLGFNHLRNVTIHSVGPGTVLKADGLISVGYKGSLLTKQIIEQFPTQLDAPWTVSKSENGSIVPSVTTFGHPKGAMWTNRPSWRSQLR
jgi:hypothetical protein